MTGGTAWLDLARQWSTQREALAEVEDGDKRYLEACFDNDEDGALLVEVALTAIEALAAMDPCAWSENAHHFTCGEADAVAAMLRLVSDDLADGFMRAHAEHDDAHEGDYPSHLALKGA